MAIVSTSKLLCMFLVLSVALPSTFAREYVVGGNFGWSVDADPQAWVAPLGNIKIGDTLRFEFDSPQTVAVVDQTGYATCDASRAQINDASGSFTYTVTESGIVSFISAGPGDCAAGLKMQVIAL